MMTLKLSGPMLSSKQNKLKTCEIADCDSEDVFINSAPPVSVAYINKRNTVEETERE